MRTSIAKQIALGTAAALTLVGTGPALAANSVSAAAHAAAPGHANAYGTSQVWHEQKAEHKSKHRKHDHYRDGYYGRDRDHYRSYGEPVYRDTRVWRGRDGRYYCRRENGTTGLLIGAGVGALIGHEVAGRGGDRTLGAILGAAGGAILGRSIDRSDTRCR